MAQATPRTALPRHAVVSVHEALVAGRVAMIGGPRQAGKTTLAQVVARRLRGDFVSLDDELALRSALADPTAFVARDRLLVIDEFQRAGEPLLRAIKARVDRDRRKGQFLLTGSSRFLTLPGVSESLAGRVLLVDLGPLTQGELRRRRDDLAAILFADPGRLRALRPQRLGREAYVDLVCRGGFPEVRSAVPSARRAWFASYVRTIVQRDALEVARIRRLGDLPVLLRLLAARTAQELNVSDIARDVATPRNTLEDYLLILEQLYLWQRIPAWSRNLTQRVIRHPKLHLVDSGLAAHLRGETPASLRAERAASMGPLLETFVCNELLRQRSWTSVPSTLHHYRDAKGTEVDLVLEADDGRVVGVEVKASASFDERSLGSLARLRDRVGSSFVHGVVLYLGRDVLPMGDRLTALPVSALWASPASGTRVQP